MITCVSFFRGATHKYKFVMFTARCIRVTATLPLCVGTIQIADCYIVVILDIKVFFSRPFNCSCEIHLLADGVCRCVVESPISTHSTFHVKK